MYVLINLNILMATDQKSISPWTMGRCQDILEGSPFLHDLELGSLERWRKRSSLLLLSLSANNPLQFQQQIPGNVIPMQAFINTMADTTINGKPAVSARVVSYWQGFAEMSKTLGMFTGGYFADRLGRK